jgi:hypothetical protein
MMAAVSSDFIQSLMALRTVSTQSHHPSGKMAEEGLEQIEDEDEVRQKFERHRKHSFLI